MVEWLSSEPINHSTCFELFQPRNAKYAVAPAKAATAQSAAEPGSILTSTSTSTSTLYDSMPYVNGGASVLFCLALFLFLWFSPEQRRNRLQGRGIVVSTAVDAARFQRKDLDGFLREECHSILAVFVRQ